MDKIYYFVGIVTFWVLVVRYGFVVLAMMFFGIATVVLGALQAASDFLLKGRRKR